MKMITTELIIGILSSLDTVTSAGRGDVQF